MSIQQQKQKQSFQGLIAMLRRRDKLQQVGAILEHHPQYLDKPFRFQQMNQIDDTGSTILIDAVKKNQSSIVRLLLNCHDISIDTSDTKEYMTALMYAAIELNTDIFSMLLEKGADPNIQDNAGVTTLMIAIMNRKNDMVQILLEKGAFPNIQSSIGSTALIYACDIDGEANDADVQLLLDYGADQDLSNDYGDTALIRAVVKHHYRIVVKLIHNGADVNHQNKNRRTALMEAVSAGDLIMTRILVPYCGIGIHLRGIYERRLYTALDIASSKGFTEIVRLLMDYVNDHISSALDVAKEKENHAVIQVLSSSSMLKSFTPHPRKCKPSKKRKIYLQKQQDNPQKKRRNLLGQSASLQSRLIQSRLQFYLSQFRKKFNEDQFPAWYIWLIDDFIHLDSRQEGMMHRIAVGKRGQLVQRSKISSTREILAMNVPFVSDLLLSLITDIERIPVLEGQTYMKKDHLFSMSSKKINQIVSPWITCASLSTIVRQLLDSLHSMDANWFKHMPHFLIKNLNIYLSLQRPPHKLENLTAFPVIDNLGVVHLVTDINLSQGREQIEKTMTPSLILSRLLIKLLYLCTIVMKKMKKQRQKMQDKTSTDYISL